MSRKSQKRGKLNRAVSFMLTLVMAVVMLPSFSMPKVRAASGPSVSITGYAKTGDSYRITDISIENIAYDKILSITLSVTDKSDVINVSAGSGVNIVNSHYSNGEYYVEFNSSKSASWVENFIKSKRRLQRNV